MYDEVIDSIRSRARELGIPFDGMFELTARCNLRCKFCYVCDRSKRLENQDVMSTADWLDIIKQATKAGMLECSFTGGDPFMREDFEEIYCKAYDMGLRTSILTNAILIGDKELRFLSKRIPDMISISLYGASRTSYEKICGDGENFNRVIDSLNRLSKSGIPFEIKVLALRPLIEEYETLGHIAEMYKCNKRFDAYLSPRRDHSQEYVDEWRIPVSIVKKAQNDFFKDLSERTKVIPSTKNETKRIVTGVPCAAGKNVFMITYDGKMMGCPVLTCFRTFPLEYGFAKAWRDLRNIIQKAQVCDQCRQCPEYNLCLNCAARRLLETGTTERCSSYLYGLAHALNEN